MDDLINMQLGQYRLTEVIRRGGMSTVYKAYQQSLDRYVAVKVLFHGQNPQFVARFQREARAIAHLQHPNILPIFDYGEQDGLLFLVLQYIEQGMTLGDLLGHPMEPVPALQLMGRVLAALDYAHERGIVHRDVKPANILMPTPSWPMLSDFGIVKLLADNENSNLTAQGMIIGTPAYLAPEQVLGMHIDRRTDLYSAGIVFYEMVTGRVPFDTGTPIVVATKQAYEPPPPPLVLNPDLPKAIELVVMRALEKDPANRYQTAAEMAAALERVAQQLERPQAPRPAPGRPEAEDTGPDLDAEYMAGIAAFEAGRWEQAAQRLRQVVATDPTYADAATMLEAAEEAQAQQSGPPPAPPLAIPQLPVPPAPVAPAPPPGVMAAPAGPPVAPRAASDTRPAAEAAASPAPPVALPPTPTTTTTRRARQRRITPPPGEITVPPAAAPSTGAAHRTETEAATPPARAGAAPAAVPFSAPAPPAVPAVPATALPAATPPADATPAGSTTTARRTRRRATPAETPAAVETEQPAPVPPTDTTKTRAKTSTTRRSSRPAAADTTAPPAAPAAAAAAATALPDAAVVRAAPAPPPPAAAVPPPQAREIAAAPVSMAAAVPVAPVPPAPPAAPSGAQNLRPVAQRRSPVPFVAVGAGVLLLILAAIFGPGLLAGRSGNGGSPTPAATAPATAAAAPSATSGLPLGAVTGSETPGVASPTPAQGAGEPTVATTEPPSAIPATAAPTEAATAVMDMPTPAAIPPTTNEGAVGVVRFTDDGQHVVDQVVVSITLSTLSAPPAGQGRVAWLVNSTTGASLNLGRVTPNAQGAWTQTYTDTQQANLLASYDGFLVTNEALDTTPFAPSSDIVLRGQLPVQALVHIAHLLVSYPDTPNQVALEVGLRAQVDALITHAQQLSTAQATSNLANVKREAEAIANLIAGAKAPGFGDLDKDGLIQTAGDGFGLLQNSPQDGYLLGVKDHAELSAAAADATDNVKQHASGVAITTDNVQVWATQILDKARAIISADNPTATRPLVADILGLATYIEQGQAIGTDGNIRPVKGSGGAITSYQEALGMAAIPIQPAK